MSSGRDCVTGLDLTRWHTVRWLDIPVQASKYPPCEGRVDAPSCSVATPLVVSGKRRQVAISDTGASVVPTHRVCLILTGTGALGDGLRDNQLSARRSFQMNWSLRSVLLSLVVNLCWASLSVHPVSPTSVFFSTVNPNPCQETLEVRIVNSSIDSLLSLSLS